MNQSQHEHLMKICERPGMFLPDGNFEQVCSYIDGLHAANGCLIGFREWLIVKLDTGNNMMWQVLIQIQLDNESTPVDRRVSRLGEIINDFYQFTGSTLGASNGLLKVYVQYHGWLLGKRWYNSERPEYVPPYQKRPKE